MKIKGIITYMNRKASHDYTLYRSLKTDQIVGRKAKSSQNPQSACLKCQNECNDECKKTKTMTARCEHIKNVDVSEVAKSTISQRFLSTMLYRLNFDNTQ